MIILSVIRAKLRIVFENIPACEEISHLLSLCLSHASWYNGTKRQNFFKPLPFVSAMCRERKINLRQTKNQSQPIDFSFGAEKKSNLRRNITRL